MLMATFLFCLAWGVGVCFFLLLLRISARPVPAPPPKTTVMSESVPSVLPG